MGAPVRAPPPQGPWPRPPPPLPRETALTCAEAREGDRGPGHAGDASTRAAS